MGRPALDKPGNKSLYVRGLDDLTVDVLHVYTSFGNRSQADVIAEALRVFTRVRAAENHHWAKWCQDRHYGRADKKSHLGECAGLEPTGQLANASISPAVLATSSPDICVPQESLATSSADHTYSADPDL